MSVESRMLSEGVLKGQVRAVSRTIAAASQNIVSGDLYSESDPSAVPSIARLSLHQVENQHQKDYLEGAVYALSMVISGLQERGLSPYVRGEFERRNAVVVLLEIAEHPGLGVGSLVDNLIEQNPQTCVAQIENYCQFLEKAGFVEPALPTDGLKRAWALTPWGVRTFAKLEEQERERKLFDKINQAHELAALNTRISGEETSGK